MKNLFGDEIIGDNVFGAASTNRAVLIKVLDVPGLVKAQGGALGGLVHGLAPETLETKVYDELSKKLASGLKDQKVNASVTVVEPSGFQAAGGSPIWKPLAIGLGATSLVLLAWKIFGGRK